MKISGSHVFFRPVRDLVQGLDSLMIFIITNDEGYVVEVLRPAFRMAMHEVVKAVMYIRIAISVPFVEESAWDSV